MVLKDGEVDIIDFRVQEKGDGKFYPEKEFRLDYRRAWTRLSQRTIHTKENVFNTLGEAIKSIHDYKKALEIHKASEELKENLKKKAKIVVKTHEVIFESQ